MHRAFVLMAVVTTIASGWFESSRSIADDKPAEQAVEPKSLSATPEQIAEWIKDLDCAKFETRERATQKLIQAGKIAIDDVGKAADTENLEVASRSFTVLKELSLSTDIPTKSAALAALKKLSTSDNRAVARRANAILNPPEVPAANNNLLRGRMRVNGGVRVAGGQRIQVQVRNNNGQIEVNVDENGKKVQISSQNGKEIVMKITEPVEGKEPKLTEVKAADEAELKQKDPEAFKLYEKYTKGNRGQANIIFGAGGLPGGIAAGNIQIEVGGNQVVPPNPAIPDPVRALQEIEKAQAEIAKLVERLKVASQKPDLDAGELKKLAEEIQAANQRIADAQKKLKN